MTLFLATVYARAYYQRHPRAILRLTGAFCAVMWLLILGALAALA